MICLGAATALAQLSHLEIRPVLQETELENRVVDRYFYPRPPSRESDQTIPVEKKVILNEADVLMVLVRRANRTPLTEGVQFRLMLSREGISRIQEYFKQRPQGYVAIFYGDKLLQVQRPGIEVQKGQLSFYSAYHVTDEQAQEFLDELGVKYEFID